MPEQSRADAGLIPGGVIPQEDQKSDVGSPQAGEKPLAPQANVEAKTPVAETAAPVMEKPTGEDTTKKLYREVQSLKDTVDSQKAVLEEQKDLITSYVPTDELESREKRNLELEKAQLQQEKEALERGRIMDAVFKEPEYADLEPFKGDIKGSTEEEIRSELNDRRAIAESWKARAGKGGPTGDLPSANLAKGATEVTAEAAKNMSVQELENVLPTKS